MKKITVLVMLLFLSSTILIATKTNISFSNPSGDGKIAATSKPLVYVDPENVTKNVNETFTIDIVIADVENLYGVGIQFRWDPSILEYVSHTAKIPVETYPDGILHEPGMFVMDTVDPTAGTYEIAYASMDPAPVFAGTGIAFNMTFTVKKAGGCALEFSKDPHTGLPLIQLSSQAGQPISCDSQDGYFETPGIPTARFTWQPQIGVVGKPTIFNASESFAPDGTIVKYYWDFDDGNLTASTSAEITHVFNHSIFTKIYSVSLIVEDNATVKSAAFVRAVTIVKSRNIEIMWISLSTSLALINSTIQANVTVANTGYTTENSTLTAYYNTSATEWTKITATNVTNLQSGSAKEYSFGWNTTGVEAHKYYVIKANVTAVPYEDETDNTKTSQPIYITSTEERDLVLEQLTLRASHGGRTFALPIILGEAASFIIVVNNSGSVAEENFQVTLYSNGTAINQWDITETLDAGFTKTLEWDWTGIEQIGDYNITVQVIVENDIDLDNNYLQQDLKVIKTPLLNITYTPKPAIVNETVTLNASGSAHRDPEGQIVSYRWEIYEPGKTLGIDIPNAILDGAVVLYNFTMEGNWIILLRVTDNYGLTYDMKRTLTSSYRTETELPVIPEFPSALILPLFALATLIATILFKKKRKTKSQHFFY